MVPVLIYEAGNNPADSIPDHAKAKYIKSCRVFPEIRNEKQSIVSIL